MKPRNFPLRRLRRQQRAYRRLFKPFEDRQRVLLKQSHEAFVLHGIVPRGGFVFPPTDIRIRIGAAGRKEMMP